MSPLKLDDRSPSEELSEIGYPVFSDIGTNYFESIEIQTIMSLLKIIDNPLQEIPLVAVMRSMIGGFTDNELVEIRLSDKYDNFYNTILKAKSGDKDALERIFKECDDLISQGTKILILSDRNFEGVSIPSLLVASGVHQYLTKTSKRTHVSLILEGGEPHEIHHYACLISFGVNAIYPYLVYETIA